MMEPLIYLHNDKHSIMNHRGNGEKFSDINCSISHDRSNAVYLIIQYKER